MKLNESYKEMIVEAMLDIGNLPDTTGLYYTPLNNSGIELNLYDPVSKNIYATISAIAPSGDINHVTGVAAQKGFGPLMYEMAMMQSQLNKKWLAPASDGDVRGEAMNVWVKFYKREDVEKRTLEPKDKNFNFAILDGEESNWGPGEKEERFYNLNNEIPNAPDGDIKTTVLAFNSAYTLKPNDTFNTLIDRANDSKIDPQIPQSKGSGLWDELYN